MPYWTNIEINRLIEMHRDRRPTLKELAAAFPRHTVGSVRATAYNHGLRPRLREPLRWLRLVHLHFSKREA
jgi:hypothetical protein